MNVWAPKRLGTNSYVRQINITFWVHHELLYPCVTTICVTIWVPRKSTNHIFKYFQQEVL